MIVLLAPRVCGVYWCERESWAEHINAQSWWYDSVWCYSFTYLPQLAGNRIQIQEVKSCKSYQTHWKWIKDYRYDCQRRVCLQKLCFEGDWWTWTWSSISRFFRRLYNNFSSATRRSEWWILLFVLRRSKNKHSTILMVDTLFFTSPLKSQKDKHHSCRGKVLLFE